MDIWKNLYIYIYELWDKYVIIRIIIFMIVVKPDEMMIKNIW